MLGPPASQSVACGRPGTSPMTAQKTGRPVRFPAGFHFDDYRVNQAVSLLRRTCIVFADGPGAISELFGCGITVGELHNFSIFVERGD